MHQHSRNTGFGCLVLDRFTADGARRATSAPGHKEAIPTTTIRPSTRSGILIHNFLPYSLRLGPEPHPPIEKNGYFSSSKAQALTAHTLHRTDRLRDGAPLRDRSQKGEASKGGEQQDCLVGTTPAPGETARASIEAWQSSPPFRFRAPCPASPS